MQQQAEFTPLAPFLENDLFKKKCVRDLSNTFFLWIFYTFQRPIERTQLIENIFHPLIKNIRSGYNHIKDTRTFVRFQGGEYHV